MRSGQQSRETALGLVRLNFTSFAVEARFYLATYGDLFDNNRFAIKPRQLCPERLVSNGSPPNI